MTGGPDAEPFADCGHRHADGDRSGRRLRDDVFDTLFSLLTSPKIKTDNVAADNGAVITDGMSGSLAQFPYIGRPNNAPAAGNP